MVINQTLGSGGALYHTTADAGMIVASRTAYTYPEGGSRGTITGSLGTVNYSSDHATTTALPVARRHIGSAEIGGYALFAGGTKEKSPYFTNTVDIYDPYLTHTTNTISANVDRLGGSSNSNYAVFGGGYYSTVEPSACVEAFDAQFVKTAAANLTRRTIPAVAGNYMRVMFAGGMSPSTYEYTSIVEFYDNELTKSRMYLTSAIYAATGGNVGEYLLIAGGGTSSGGATAVVTALDASLTQSLTALTAAKTGMVHCPINDYALFAAGGGSSYWTQVDAINVSLTLTQATALSVGRSYFASASIHNQAIFSGGAISSGYTYSAVTEKYDSTLSREILADISLARVYFPGASTGDYALFPGGYKQINDTAYYYANVDYYHVAPISATIPETYIPL